MTADPVEDAAGVTIEIEEWMIEMTITNVDIDGGVVRHHRLGKEALVMTMNAIVVVTVLAGGMARVHLAARAAEVPHGDMDRGVVRVPENDGRIRGVIPEEEGGVAIMEIEDDTALLGLGRMTGDHEIDHESCPGVVVDVIIIIIITTTITRIKDATNQKQRIARRRSLHPKEKHQQRRLRILRRRVDENQIVRTKTEEVGNTDPKIGGDMIVLEAGVGVVVEIDDYRERNGGARRKTKNKNARWPTVVAREKVRGKSGPNDVKAV